MPYLYFVLENTQSLTCEGRSGVRKYVRTCIGHRTRFKSDWPWCAPLALFNPFYNFPFTGTLRPVYPLSPRRIVPPEIPRPDYVEDGE